MKSNTNVHSKKQSSVSPTYANEKGGSRANVQSPKDLPINLNLAKQGSQNTPQTITSN